MYNFEPDTVIYSMIYLFSLQLEMERALLDGEHEAEMERLQDDQEKIQQLRQKQNLLMEKASRERQKVIIGDINTLYSSLIIPGMKIHIQTYGTSSALISIA